MDVSDAEMRHQIALIRQIGARLDSYDRTNEDWLASVTVALRDKDFVAASRLALEMLARFEPTEAQKRMKRMPAGVEGNLLSLEIQYKAEAKG